MLYVSCINVNFQMVIGCHVSGDCKEIHVNVCFLGLVMVNAMCHWLRNLMWMSHFEWYWKNNSMICVIDYKCIFNFNGIENAMAVN